MNSSLGASRSVTDNTPTPLLPMMRIVRMSLSLTIRVWLRRLVRTYYVSEGFEQGGDVRRLDFRRKAV